jgi:hypothetical protein
MKELLPLVTNISALNALDKHLEIRIETVKRDFMNATTMDQVKAIQAVVYELENLRKLRERYLAAEKNNG